MFRLTKKEPNICECAGIGRQARLSGVCPRRTGSSPVTRTKFPKQTLRFGLGIFFIQLRRDLKPKRAASVKKNSPGDCFLMSRCADGYRMRKHWVVKQGGLPKARCVPSLAPSLEPRHAIRVLRFFFFYNLYLAHKIVN